MLKHPFREHHLYNLLKGYEEQTLPLDLFISIYFKNNHALGSKDRGFIAETVYALIRWKKLIDYFCPSPSWDEKYLAYTRLDLNHLQERKDIPIDVRISCPDELFEILVADYGLDKAVELSSANNYAAPTTIRVNSRKVAREALFRDWAEKYEISLTQQSADGIVFHKKIHFFELPEFKNGFFEIQDEGSQCIAHLVTPTPGEQVMDYCAGSGGKTLAFAPSMQGKGQVYLHDIRTRALQEARKRLKRAGIQNSQILMPDSPSIPKLKKKMDWILVDAPCSGTGTMRRNPDMKWKFSREMVVRLVGLQRTIFEKALSFLSPNGKIVYATCSILKDENDRQMEHFIKTYDLEIVGEPFQSFPKLGAMDGFFGVVLKRKKAP